MAIRKPTATTPKTGPMYAAMAAALDQQMNQFTAGSIIKGTISGVKGNEVLVDIGYKSEGVVPANEFEDVSQLKAGDVIDVLLMELESDNGMVILSKGRADEKLRWDAVLAKYTEGGVVTGTIRSKVRGGLIVSVDGVDAFLPGSQVDVTPVHVGQKIMMEAAPLLLPAIVCALAYWIVIRSTPHLPKPWGRRIVIGYTSLHLGSWAIMHLLVSVPFADTVRTMHQRACSSIPLEIARYKSWESNPDPHYIPDIQKRVNTAPWSSVWSVAPIPFVLVTTENYQIGPLWGLGMVRAYVWSVMALKCIFEGRFWIS